MKIQRKRLRERWTSWWILEAIEWYTVESAASERRESKGDSSNKRWRFWSSSLSAGKSFLLWWWFSRHLWRWCQTESLIPKENLPFSSYTNLHAFWLSEPLWRHSLRWGVLVQMVSSEEGILPLSLRQHHCFDLLWRRKSPSLNVLRESPGPKQMGFFDFLTSILLWENAICKEWFLTEKQLKSKLQKR